MREYKFRAFQENGKGGYIVCYSDPLFPHIFWNHVYKAIFDIGPEQYIGLKDKNGKEIYEGDIISTAYHTLDESGKEITERIVCDIFYEEESLQFIVNPPDGRLIEINDPEVLGNVHENKEILSERN